MAGFAPDAVVDVEDKDRCRQREALGDGDSKETRKCPEGQA